MVTTYMYFENSLDVNIKDTVSKSDWTKLSSYMLFMGINLATVFNLGKVHSGLPHPHCYPLNCTCIRLFYSMNKISNVHEYINVLSNNLLLLAIIQIEK